MKTIDPVNNYGGLVPANLAMPTRVLTPGSVLYEAGRDAFSLYIVNSGILKALVPAPLRDERIANLYGPGDVIGVAALEGAQHAETVVAIENAHLTPVTPELAMTDSKLSDYIQRSLARQLQYSREAIKEGELPVGARITRALARLAERFGQDADNAAIKIPLALTHEDLAALVGSSRVTVTRILGELRNEGALSGTRGEYLANPEGLEVAAHQYVMQASGLSA